jgi:hypothetical protein
VLVAFLKSFVKTPSFFSISYQLSAISFIRAGFKKEFRRGLCPFSQL